MRKWYGKSLTFACTACGACCRSPGKVFINPAEATALADSLRLPLSSFMSQYTMTGENAKGDVFTALKSKKGGCILLDDATNQCSVYEQRPTQCRTYPFWPTVLLGEAEVSITANRTTCLTLTLTLTHLICFMAQWRSEAKKCEGMRGKDSVSDDDISSNLIVHMVHDKGNGPNWSYDDSLDNLRESRRMSPEIYTEVANAFFFDNSSRTVYERDGMVVTGHAQNFQLLSLYSPYSSTPLFSSLDSFLLPRQTPPWRVLLSVV